MPSKVRTDTAPKARKRGENLKIRAGHEDLRRQRGKGSEQRFTPRGIKMRRHLIQQQCIVCAEGHSLHSMCVG